MNRRQNGFLGFSNANQFSSSPHYSSSTTVMKKLLLSDFMKWDIANYIHSDKIPSGREGQVHRQICHLRRAKRSQLDMHEHDRCLLQEISAGNAHALLSNVQHLPAHVMPIWCALLCAPIRIRRNITFMISWTDLGRRPPLISNTGVHQGK